MKLKKYLKRKIKTLERWGKDNDEKIGEYEEMLYEIYKLEKKAEEKNET